MKKCIKNKLLISRLREKNLKILFLQYVLAPYEVKVSSEYYQDMHKREYFKMVRVTILKQVFEVQKSEKYWYISTYSAASTVGWVT